MLADHCEALIGPAAPERLQQRAWAQLSVCSGNAQKHRSHDAAQRAVALARALRAKKPDPFPLYRALGYLAQAAALVGEFDAATAALVEMRTLEDPAWPPHRLYIGADAAGLTAGLQGKAAEALGHTRRAVALDRARGKQVSWSPINLIDYELAAGNAAAAARIGTELVAVLERTRDEQSLNFARLNLTAAWLALNELGAARVLARSGWPHAVRFDLHQMWADHLTLLAALDDRPQDSARLAGYADATYVALDDRRQVNETTAIERARTLARAALGEAEYDRLHADGATLRDLDVAELAFGARTC